MKKYIYMIFFFMTIVSVLVYTACNHKQESKNTPMSFAGSAPISSKVLSDNTYTMKSGDTTITQRWIMTMTENKSWPDKPIDTVVVPPVTSDRVGIIRYNSFDSFTKVDSVFKENGVNTPYPILKSTYGPSWYFTQNCCSYSINQSTDGRRGSGSYLYTLKKGDPDVSGSKRSELMSISSVDLAKFERWYGLSIKVPKTVDNLDKSLIQWHQNQSGGIPPLALWLSGTSLQIVQTKNGLISPPANLYTTVGTLPLNQWVDIVMHVKFSNESDGLIEFYMNGNLLKTIKGPNNYIGGNYLKLGVYKWTWEKKSADGTQEQIFYDEFREGTEKSNYKSVAP